MSFGKYLRTRLWDLILVYLASVSLCYVLMDGFYVMPEWQYSPIAAGVALLCLLCLCLLSYNKRTAFAGGAVYGIVLVAVWGASIVLARDFITDEEGNPFIFVFLVTLTATLCYLLSRKRAGTALMFAVGALLVAWVRFFWPEFFELGWTLLFTFSALALVVYRNYQTSVKEATSLRKVSLGTGFLVSVLAVALAVGGGSALWFGIIEQLHPSRVVLELIIEEWALENLEVKGVSDTYLTPNTDMTSNDYTEYRRTTDDLQISDDGTDMPANQKAQDTTTTQADGSFLGFDVSSLEEVYELITYSKYSYWFLLIPIVILLLIIGYFVGRRIWRRVRLECWMQLGVEGCVSCLYPFLMSRLARVGIARAEGQTLYDFCSSNKATLERFDADAGVLFESLTAAYTGVVYGNTHLTEAQLERFCAYYRSFWKAARHYLGVTKYFFRSFRLT